MATQGHPGETHIAGILRGLSKKKNVVQSLNSYWCIYHSTGEQQGLLEEGVGEHKWFICFQPVFLLLLFLQPTPLPVPARSQGPATTQSYGAALSACL